MPYMVCIRMDVTSISLGKQTRDLLKEYKTERNYDNYDEAVRELLQHVEGEHNE